MRNNVISASLSTQSLVFRPNQPPVSFEITVNNDSDRFANFQLEIEAAGQKGNADYRWYRLEPEVAAAQPHGSSTKFQVFIFNTPIPGFVGNINLTVKVFSPQLGQERRLLLRLQIERDRKPNLIDVEFPIKDYQVYPGNTVDILVKLRNMGQQPANITLDFGGIDSSWLISSEQRRLSINPGYHKDISFQCQPPSVAQAPSDIYPFIVNATSHNSYPASAEANLEVLPIGFIKFDTPQRQKTLPQTNKWLPDWKSKTVVYELLFKNASNLRQEIDIQIQGRDWRKCTYKKFPEIANLDLAQTATVNLEVTTKRPWIGIRKNLLLEARAELSDQRLGSTDPATQTLELKVLPIIPLWLQAAILALLAVLLGFLLPRERTPQHLLSVNSVAINGTATSVVSGSDDCTLRFWRVRTRKVEPDETVRANGKYTRSCGRKHKTKGFLTDAKDVVSVLKFIPVENNRVAVGLDKGVIELRESATGKKVEQLQDIKAFTDRGDRVFDLAFTSNSLYLFGGYGSGKLRIWSRASINRRWNREPKVFDFKKLQGLPDFQIRALTLSPDDQYLVIAGNFKRFLVIPVKQIISSNSLLDIKDILVQTFEEIDKSTGQEDYVWKLAFAPVSLNSNQKVMATSDSSGYITIWNLNQCKSTINIDKTFSNLNCTVLERWQDESRNSIRALAFSQDNKYLVSGGDDGKVVVWYLKDDYSLDKVKSLKGKTVFRSRKKINSIDLKSNKGFAVSGSEDSEVRLHRIK